ncbi:uncharacterized protein LTR77_010328 [Saxophila tyrrhenica]|uniref:Male-enhanced antigen 1 n=1 Tax=Saxophila tyrrhenica TaxID=1690608 RepID=A0AAV9NVT4_9PEZI|nr:hypothetical protein LTR77_010328 [Saxophila tyrrhenica]
MGACASCLGLNRHPSQDDDETDPLVSTRQGDYGTVESEEVAQPDEEELRREREALEQITMEATDNMIDASHPGTSELSQHFAHARPTTPFESSADGPSDVEEDEDEAAWLESVQAAGMDEVVPVDEIQSGNLVMDFSRLRDDPMSIPSTAKPSLKGKLPA